MGLRGKKKKGIWIRIVPDAVPTVQSITTIVIMMDTSSSSFFSFHSLLFFVYLFSRLSPAAL